MSLPLYQTLTLKSSSLDDVASILSNEMNLKHPVAIMLKDLDLDAQREIIGLIENFFVSKNISFKFPYPIYVISDHEMSITKLPLVHDQSELPQFYTQRESKMNVKEAHLSSKNKLLQQEIINSDASTNQYSIENYADSHRLIHQLESERVFYLSILNKLLKGKKDG